MTEVPTRWRGVFLHKAIAAFSAALAAALIVAAASALAAPGEITSAAGTTLLGKSISIRLPAGLAYDAQGNLYFAEGGNHRVRRVDTAGKMTTFAGTSAEGSSGDGGPAREALLASPRDVAVDPAGNVYVAEYAGNRVRRIDGLGRISTFAGTGTAGFGGDGGPAASAPLNRPSGLAVDAEGNVYIADQYNGRIRKVNSLGVISTIAGDGLCGYFGDGGPVTSSRLCLPGDVAVDAAGNIYIADTYNSVVRKASSAGIMSTVAGNTVPMYFGDGLPATLASLNWPGQVAVDGQGRLLIADTYNHRIRRVDQAGYISTVAGSTIIGPGGTVGQPGFAGDGGQAASAVLNTPGGVAANPAGGFVIGDTNNHRVRSVAPTGVIVGLAGGGTATGCDFNGDGAATAKTVCFPAGMTVDSSGSVLFAERYSSRIRKLVPGGVVTTVAGKGTPGFSGDGGPGPQASLNMPEDVALDSAGNLYIADTANGKIRILTPAGIISTVATISRPRSVAVDAADQLYAVSGESCKLQRFTATTTVNVVNSAGCGYSGDGGSALTARLNNPADITFDSAGNLYIADEGNHRIRKIDTAGIITTFAGTGIRGFSGDGGSASAARLAAPRAVLADGAGNVWISDTDNNRIRRVDSAGNIGTVAGAGTPGDAAARLAGDGGSAFSALLSYPWGVAIPSSGHLFIADSINDRIRKVEGPLP